VYREKDFEIVGQKRRAGGGDGGNQIDLTESNHVQRKGLENEEESKIMTTV